MSESMIDFGPLIPPPPGMKPCSPELRKRVLDEYTAYYEKTRNRGRNVRVASLILLGLLAVAVTYVKFHRLSPKMNPMEMAYPTVPHPGIRPKPPAIQPRDQLPMPAIEKWRYLPRYPPRMHQKLPNGIELIRESLPADVSPPMSS